MYEENPLIVEEKGKTLFSTKNQESDLFLTLNNDILRIVKILDTVPEIRKLLSYIDTDPLDQEDIEKSLIDEAIWRTPLLPMEPKVYRGSHIQVALLSEDMLGGYNNAQTMIAIDVWTPPEQWLIDNGLRPYWICHYIDRAMRLKYNQTAGVKYRLVQVIDAKLSDRLLGFRMVYETVLEH